MEHETQLVHNQYWTAWCRECAWHGPRRFARYLAREDAEHHDRERHPEEAEAHGDGPH